MIILVLDTAAEYGGALTVLEEYYRKATVDKENEYVFLTGIIELKETPNVRCASFAWTKKNWLYRLLFDYIYLPFYIRRNQFDRILSLQNIGVPFVKNEQYVYIHNALPFVEHKFKLRNNPKMWFYQNIIGFLIKKSAKKANKVIVQCDWLKEELSNQLIIDEDNIIIEGLEPVIPEVEENEKWSDKTTFFYPASAEEFKNHKVLVEACKLLAREHIDGYQVLLTLAGNENSHITRLYDEVKDLNLPIYFINRQTREDVFRLYKYTILVFPSYIETIGLPLTEAASLNQRILAADLKYAHSTLKNYSNVRYFNPYSSSELATYMKESV